MHEICMTGHNTESVGIAKSVWYAPCAAEKTHRITTGASQKYTEKCKKTSLKLLKFENLLRVVSRKKQVLYFWRWRMSSHYLYQHVANDKKKICEGDRRFRLDSPHFYRFEMLTKKMHWHSNVGLKIRKKRLCMYTIN